MIYLVLHSATIISVSHIALPTSRLGMHTLRRDTVRTADSIQQSDVPYHMTLCSVIKAG